MILDESDKEREGVQRDFFLARAQKKQFPLTI